MVFTSILYLIKNIVGAGLLIKVNQTTIINQEVGSLVLNKEKSVKQCGQGQGNGFRGIAETL